MQACFAGFYNSHSLTINESLLGLNRPRFFNKKMTLAFVLEIMKTATHMQPIMAFSQVFRVFETVISRTTLLIVIKIRH